MHFQLLYTVSYMCGIWRIFPDRAGVGNRCRVIDQCWPQPLLDWASGWNMEDSTMASSRVKLFRSLFQCFHVWEFPLHGVWGNLAELWWEGLVWTPRRAFPQIPSAGSWGRSRYAIAVGSYTPAQGNGRGLPRPRQIPSPPGDPWMNIWSDR